MSAETKTTRLLIGEPDPRLFEVGPDLIEMKPSEVEQRWWDLLQVNLDALGLDAQEKAVIQRELQHDAAEADKRYQSKEK